MEYGDLKARALRFPYVRTATSGYACQSCTGMLPGPLGYGPTTPHHRRETFEKDGFLSSVFFEADSILLDSTQFYCFYSILLDFDSIRLNSTRFYSILLKFMQNQYKSQITTTQASASPGDGSMGTTGPDYMWKGMGLRARLRFVRKLCKKSCNFDTPPRALRGGAFMRVVYE